MEIRNLYQLAKQQNIEVLTFPLPENGSMSHMTDTGPCYIGMDDGVCDGGIRERVHLAHELGHILLKHMEDTPVEEAEANCFAGHLLCPVPAVEGMAAEEIAASCYVSRAAALNTLENRRGCCENATLKKVEKLFEKGIDK